MLSRRIAANDQYQACVFNVAEWKPESPPYPTVRIARGGRRLAIAGAVVDVIRTDHGARQFLHQIAFSLCTSKKK